MDLIFNNFSKQKQTMGAMQMNQFNPFEQQSPAGERKNHPFYRVATGFASFMIMAGFGMLGYMAYNVGSDSGSKEGEIKVVQADRLEIIEFPEDKGGMAIPNQGMMIYDAASKENNQDPAQEQAQNSSPAIQEFFGTQEVAAVAQPQQTGKIAETIELKTASEVIGELNKNESFSEVKQKLQAKQEPQVKKEGAEVAEKTEKKIAVNEFLDKIEPAAAPVEAAPKSVFSGEYGLQVGSYKTHQAALADVENVVAKSGGVLSSQMKKDIQKANLGDKGTFFRLRLGGFGNQSEAAAACTKLKSKGQNCMVVKM